MSDDSDPPEQFVLQEGAFPMFTLEQVAEFDKQLEEIRKGDDD